MNILGEKIKSKIAHISKLTRFSISLRKHIFLLIAFLHGNLLRQQILILLFSCPSDIKLLLKQQKL